MKSTAVTLHLLQEKEISQIVEAFELSRWTKKPLVLFEEYLKEQQADQRLVYVARVNDDIGGYATLKWQSDYPPFKENGIPEIVDLNVLPSFRRNGIATSLIAELERIASKKCRQIGIGVGLYAGNDGGYGAAQKLYVKLGYVPNGLGVTYRYDPVTPGQTYPIDDDLILWLTKILIT